MGIGKVALVGHGLGALVAMLFAAKHAYLVDRMMVISVPVAGESLLDWAGDASPAELADRLLDQKPGSEAARAETTKTDIKAVMCSSYTMISSGLRSSRTGSPARQRHQRPGYPNNATDRQRKSTQHVPPYHLRGLRAFSNARPAQ